MPDEPQSPEARPYPRDGFDVAPPPPNTMWRNVLLGVAAIYVAASLWFMVDLRGRLEKVESRQSSSETASAELAQRLTGTQTELKTDTAALASKLGMTQRQ